jgi:hypothetical protein
MKTISRRQVVAGMATIGIGALGGKASVSEQMESVGLAFAGRHEPKPLPLNPNIGCHLIGEHLFLRVRFPGP